MEFKVIFYVLVAIGYFIYTNYKKLTEENSKRKLSHPQVPSGIPVIEQLKTIVKKEIQKAKPVYQAKKVAAPRQQVARTIKEKIKTVSTSFDIQSLETLAAQSPVFSQNIGSEGKVATVNRENKNIFDFKNMRNTIILGEILNKPAWTKY